MIPVFYKKSLATYYTNKRVSCDFCGEILENNFFYSVDAFRRGLREVVCCSSKACLRLAKRSSSGLIGHRLIVCYSEENLILDCEPVVFDFNSVNAKNFDVTIQPRDDTTRLKHAGRESWEGASVGLIDHERLRELDDPALADKAARKLLREAGYSEVRR